MKNKLNKNTIYHTYVKLRMPDYDIISKIQNTLTTILQCKIYNIIRVYAHVTKAFQFQCIYTR